MLCSVTQSVQLFETPRTLAHQARFSRQEHWGGLPCPPPGDLPNPGIEPGSHTLQADSLLFEPPGKTKNTGVGSLSLLQGIFSSQELNWGLLHCRQILYQLRYQGGPNFCWVTIQILYLEGLCEWEGLLSQASSQALYK